MRRPGRRGIVGRFASQPLALVRLRNIHKRRAPRVGVERRRTRRETRGASSSDASSTTASGTRWRGPSSSCLTPVIFGGLGWLLDRWLGTWPVFTARLLRLHARLRDLEDVRALRRTRCAAHEARLPGRREPRSVDMSSAEPDVRDAADRDRTSPSTWPSARLPSRRSIIAASPGSCVAPTVRGRPLLAVAIVVVNLLVAARDADLGGAHLGRTCSWPPRSAASSCGCSSSPASCWAVQDEPWIDLRAGGHDPGHPPRAAGLGVPLRRRPRSPFRP